MKEKNVSPLHETMQPQPEQEHPVRAQPSRVWELEGCKPGCKPPYRLDPGEPPELRLLWPPLQVSDLLQGLLTLLRGSEQRQEPCGSADSNRKSYRMLGSLLQILKKGTQNLCPAILCSQPQDLAVALSRVWEGSQTPSLPYHYTSEHTLVFLQNTQDQSQ